ncbi:LppU/SCO3897 family protein [Plantactinospora sp. WMMB782]|uniref:LppU/SCO3897 family protein n=1 Tax=Plantactinospora sp. WMMB782 TaxID=3404121 RepID=UPI003B96351A
MSTYPPPGYGPDGPSQDPRQSGGYGAPGAGGDSGYPPPSGSYPPPSSGSYPPPSGYPAQGDYPSAPDSAGQTGTPVPPKKSKAPLIVGIVLGVLLLCCGGGTAAVLWAGDDEDPSNASAEQTPTPEPSAKTTPPKGKPSPTPEEDSVEGNLDQFKKGDCLTLDDSGKVEEASCGARGALKVLLRKDGTISESACENTEYTQYLYQDGTIGTLQDFILCVAPAR